MCVCVCVCVITNRQVCVITNRQVCVAINFAGTEDKLYVLVGSTWNDASGVDAPFATPADERWTFMQFGDLVIANNYGDAPQKFNLFTGGDFSPLGGNPPKGRYAAVVRDFVVMGGLSDAPNAIHWSAFNDPEEWTIGLNQSDKQVFPDGGWVRGIIGGEQGYIFLERAIIRMTMTGDDFVFQFDVIERERGVRAPGSLVQVGRIAFYLGQDGFYQFDGSQSVPIGAHKVDKTFFQDLNEAYLPRLSGVADPLNKVVAWSYPSKQSVDGTPDKLIMYNWATQQWSQADFATALIFPLLMPGKTLEELDTISADLDALAFSLDSRLWTGGALTLGAFDDQNKLATLTGAPLEATIETKEAEPIDGRRAFVNEVRPAVDTDQAMVSIGRRERVSDALSYATEVGATTSGAHPVRASGRFHRARIRIPANEEWTHAQGVDFMAVEDGAR